MKTLGWQKFQSDMPKIHSHNFLRKNKSTNIHCGCLLLCYLSSMMDHNYILDKLIDHGLLLKTPHLLLNNCRGCQKVLDVGRACCDCDNDFPSPYRPMSGKYYLHPFVPAIFCSSNCHNNQLNVGLPILLDRLSVKIAYEMPNKMNVLDEKLMHGARWQASQDLNGPRRIILDCLASGDFTRLANMPGEQPEDTLFKISKHVQNGNRYSIATHHLNQMIIVFQAALFLNRWQLLALEGGNNWGQLTEFDINGNIAEEEDDEDDELLP